MRSVCAIMLTTLMTGPVAAFEEAIDYAATLECRTVSVCRVDGPCKNKSRELRLLLVVFNGEQAVYLGHAPKDDGYYTRVELLDDGFHGKPDYDFSTSLPNDHAVDFRGGNEDSIESGVLHLAYVPRGYEWIERYFTNSSLSEFLVEFQGCESK